MKPPRVAAPVVIVGVLSALFAAALYAGGGGGGALSATGLTSQSLRYAAPIALAALSGLVCERSGVVNIGIEGMMLTGAMVAYATNLFLFVALRKSGVDPAAAGAASRAAAMAAAAAASGLLAALHATVSIRFRANQIVSGTVVNILAVGVTGYGYRQFLAHDLPPGPGTFPPIDIPLLSRIPFLGAAFFSGQKPLVYLVPVLVVAIHALLFHTSWGLRTRAVGENPRAADSVGIDVARVRFVNVVAGGLIAGVGGSWFTLEAVDVFNPLMTNGLGFIGLAAMIFGRWTPLGAWGGALIFGLGGAVTTALGISRPDIPSQLPQLVPYVLTMIVIAGFAGRAAPPAAIGMPYPDHEETA